jgi:ATP diphosphatase
MPYNIDDLLHLMKCLRDPDNGCPWDLEQTAQSVINYSIEEVYELAQTIESGEKNAQKNELGDLLFQVIFLSRLAEEADSYTFSDVVNSLCEKLLRRHPHVFTNGELYQQHNTEVGERVSTAEVAQNWEQIKQAERQHNKQAGLFDDLPLNLPALSRATKIQKRAESIGLDWPDALAALAKLNEEVGELEQQIGIKDSDNKAAQQEELGDVLFSCVNVARKLGINAEQSLRMASNKFIRRALVVENSLAGSAGEAVSPAQIDTYWNAAKMQENQ